MAASKPKASDGPEFIPTEGPDFVPHQGMKPKEWPGAKTVQLFRVQDKFITAMMSEAEAQSLLDGYPGEYLRYPDELAAPAADPEA